MSAAPEQSFSEHADGPMLQRADKDGVATLTLNRPAARNALSFALMETLRDALRTVARDDAAKVVVIAANGPAFCAGHDLKEMRATVREDYYRSVFALCSDLMQTIVTLPKPVIAKVHAMASAAGCQLVASCDLAYAADAARFATPGVNIGLFCSTPMVALSRAVGRKQAMKMLLTGEAASAREAAEAGLVNEVVPAAELDATVDRVAGLIASKSPLTLKIGKEAFYKQAEMPLAEAYAYCAEVMTRNMLTEDAAEGISAFIEKRTPTWRGV